MNKIILGINSNHADSSACIIVNGKIVAAAEEERFNRIKHWAGFPENSILYCLEDSGIKFKDIDEVAINTNPISNFGQNFLFFEKLYFRKKN